MRSVGQKLDGLVMRCWAVGGSRAPGPALRRRRPAEARRSPRHAAVGGGPDHGCFVDVGRGRWRPSGRRFGRCSATGCTPGSTSRGWPWTGIDSAAWMRNWWTTFGLAPQSPTQPILPGWTNTTGGAPSLVGPLALSQLMLSNRLGAGRRAGLRGGHGRLLKAGSRRHEAVSADASRQSRRHHEPGGTKATISDTKLGQRPTRPKAAPAASTARSDSRRVCLTAQFVAFRLLWLSSTTPPTRPGSREWKEVP